MKPRYQPVAKAFIGRPIAVIYDSHNDQTVRVYKHNSRWRCFDAVDLDRPVFDRKLIAAAKKVLAREVAG